ncbi:DUF799 domain-containing protein [Gilliamella sp. B2776]|uniref:DUF799 domain-containing protein n=1 Tax=unclassified Gilliamella TaxID=2685620 RepID=UPI002269F467|nr:MULTISPECIES: DUF799 domain-containing protein [unclassified Gilliamella]MCX8648912.1 DUF799 domain-containing protein [Gilliamella sp. B2779]MCX8653212.1 DUF799 domain-containing protein [Gilliamella sp. B2737]MCX8655472.1 DUF799 domain-containing protein [Gilliamella sp. B2894]MCX8664237.1 DUF799 domain-containing protein [Gilliamella sp. B2887]MCX8690724.1 DUF799 domain-containing protein [Gilliamella sp. B2776]
MKNKIIALLGTLLALFMLVGCSTQKGSYDYTAFKESKPASILVLLPTNHSNELSASFGVFSQVTFPLSEAGYYVFPVNLTYEVFKQNGLIVADEIQSVSLAKIRKIFNPDAVLFINIQNYGTNYQIIQSDTRVTLDAKLVDARSEKILWTGSASASSLENQQTSNSLISTLISAAITQITNTVRDHSVAISGVATARLFTPNPIKADGILYGPYAATKVEN